MALFSGIAAAIGTASDAVMEWTPLVLLSLFLVSSMLLYIALPPRWNEGLFWAYTVLQTFVSLSVTVEAVHSIRPAILARRARRKAEKEGFTDLAREKDCPFFDIVVVAYLPNEADIILKQMRYIIRELRYPASRFNLMVVYNTPKPMEALEAEMQALAGRYDNVQVHKVLGSKSKCDNVNYYLKNVSSIADIVAILFGGSNGYWNASLLRSLGMDGRMLTEDIDATMRAITSGARVAYDIKIVSFETAPTTFKALLKQRLRWSQGWTQVALRHSLTAIKRGAHGAKLRSRLGMWFLLPFREMYFYLPIQLTCLLLAYVILNPPRTFADFWYGLTGYHVTNWLLAFNIISLATVSMINLRNRSPFTRPWAIILFGICCPLWFTMSSIGAVFAHFRQVAKYEKWNPTARGAPKPKVVIATPRVDAE
ncbi:hypothetical protein CBOM_04480 [Ceraceosorus bombacis]|uniref:Glycosyltransferase 2-like domain-containing protein n=1 Tax=Ceraceosorus bombacis TaxID=401625 RepID=A0A0N7LB06_9BASI|nr:hypothetical protein CBOM_04480 [Ceraceosorus bombacis]